MITIPVDEGYAFDFLSILEIKFRKLLIPFEPFYECEQHIVSQIGFCRYMKIYNSPEYRALWDANEKTFQTMELAKTNAISSKQINDDNYQRYLCKVALTKRFFGEDNVLEKKSA